GPAAPLPRRLAFPFCQWSGGWGQRAGLVGAGGIDPPRLDRAAIDELNERTQRVVAAPLDPQVIRPNALHAPLNQSALRNTQDLRCLRRGPQSRKLGVGHCVSPYGRCVRRSGTTVDVAPRGKGAISVSPKLSSWLVPPRSIC